MALKKKPITLTDPATGSTIGGEPAENVIRGSRVSDPDDWDVPDFVVSEGDVDEYTQLLLNKLDAACEVIEAQARLLEAYELRRPRVQALARLADARKAWEVVNG